MSQKPKEIPDTTQPGICLAEFRIFYLLFDPDFRELVGAQRRGFFLGQRMIMNRRFDRIAVNFIRDDDHRQIALQNLLNLLIDFPAFRFVRHGDALF